MQSELETERVHQEETLRQILLSNVWFKGVLEAVREVGLPDWRVGGGVIRNLVWDYLSGYTQPSYLADVDVAFFDPTDLRRERDEAVERELCARRPDVPWEVINQAAVHLWFEAEFGYAVEPLQSLEDAVSTWPETATSVAVSLDADGRLKVIAPLGLADLFDRIIRRNPRRVSIERYRQRVVEKQYSLRWPKVRIIE